MHQISSVNQTHKQCKECTANFRGRSDKKFCSTECRVSYHNRINYDINRNIRAVNIILRRNRKILHALCSEQRYRVFEHELLSLNFNFNYYTRKIKQPNGKERIYCYEYAYTFLDNDLLQITHMSKSLE